MTFLLMYKWVILICLEVLAWLSTFFMFYARYGLKSNKLFKLGVFLTVLTGVIPQVTLGIINFASTREVDVFTIVLVIIIIYGLTFGKKEVKKLDKWVQRKFVGKKEGEPHE
ncbi:hypothetical protein EV207_1686 [Scopulibacillus darangshiensis]|uniref:Uncharacterized protein n=1 Tax=Scopulibacillus darangshiensis TaxID=442528 RepID=A0A4R2ND48_9BACL|nr:hypothetical protein [Scopulibacillus darangshiensis]TCP18998.1 hypothetical protein EV207_1686 [Scopulibacillus darangshiensis]